MASSLSEQAAMAAEFIERAWPQAKEAAWGLFDRRNQEIRQVILCGCGDSHHAAVSLSWAITNWSGLPAAGLTSMDAARYLIPHLNSEAGRVLLVAISTSGATDRTREAVALARTAGMLTLAVTSAPGGPLAGEADTSIRLQLPPEAAGVGLLSYLASLIAGYALGAWLAPPGVREQVNEGLERLPGSLAPWQTAQAGPVAELLDRFDPAWPLVFLGSGPAHGSARFAAAKCIEASGQVAWAQDVEEWAHLEYFCEPAELPVWILSGQGASAGREREVAEAARRIGRTLALSEWEPSIPMPAWLRESLSPLVLWSGPLMFADQWMTRIGQEPFRGFGGGRSREHGGGISRIRNSERLSSIAELHPFQSRN
jgi:glucosamine--fructose-6-phosphate aminotransferase (isomerizing)